MTGEKQLKMMSTIEARQRTALQLLWATMSSIILIFVLLVGQALTLRIAAVGLNDTGTALQGSTKK